MNERELIERYFAAFNRHDLDDEPAWWGLIQYLLASDAEVAELADAPA